jgi:hypothetical protein
MSTPNNNNVTAAPRYYGDPIWMNPTDPPFVIFVLLSGTLILVTLISILIMIRQHSKHLQKINAVRGFHQNDIQAAQDMIEKNSHHQQQHYQNPQHRRASRSGSLSLSQLGGGSMSSSSNASKGPAGVGAIEQPTRLIYDFHHTPKQPDLVVGAPMPPNVPHLNLDALANNGSMSNSSFSASPKRAVGMSLRKK